MKPEPKPFKEPKEVPSEDQVDREFEIFQKILHEDFDNNPFAMLPAMAMFFTFMLRSLYNMNDPRAKQAAMQIAATMQGALQTCDQPWPTQGQAVEK